MRIGKGLTLTELLIAALVASLAIGATMVCFSHIFYLSEVAKDTSLAISDIRDIIEEIWSTPFDSITVRFPAAVIDGGAANDYRVVVGGYMLSQESIIVNYADPSADPLEIMVTLSWQDMRGRNRLMHLATFRTR